MPSINVPTGSALLKSDASTPPTNSPAPSMIPQHGVDPRPTPPPSSLLDPFAEDTKAHSGGGAVDRKGYGYGYVGETLVGYVRNGAEEDEIVFTIGPSTTSKEMMWKLAEIGMNVARLNMPHGYHASHQTTIDLVKEYIAQFEDKAIAIMLDS